MMLANCNWQNDEKKPAIIEALPARVLRQLYIHSQQQQQYEQRSY